MLEVRRKIAHLFLGVILALLYYVGWLDYKTLGVSIVLFLIIFTFARKLRAVKWLVKYFEREKVRFKGEGFLFYLLGVEIVIAFFPWDIAIAAILILAFGDSVPKLVDNIYGRIKHPFSDRKYMEGALVGVLFSFGAAMAVLPWYEALIASIVAVFLEGIDMNFGVAEIDDNIIVPLVAALVVSFLRIVI